MSGIYGVWKPSAQVKEYATDINRLASWNKAYGSSSQNLYIRDTVFMGCSYEKLMETAPKSSPVLKADGKYAVIDALIYNRQELLEKGQFPITLSDEELIFSCIEKFGFDELKNINGDFSGAIYDAYNDTLTLFRDHMGVRPLFFFAKERFVAFSTDIRGLVSMQQIDVSVDEKWLWNKIMGTAYIGTENTEFAHIFCVKPASYITFTLNHAEIQSNTISYWKLR